MADKISIALLCAGVVFATSAYAATAPASTPASTVASKPGELKAIMPTDATDEPIEYNKVVLQGLDKVTGRISKLEGEIGKPMHFGQLQIIAKRCWKSPPEERPENAALLEITETKTEEGSQNIFTGWMFSSSPGLSGLENPVYDIDVLSCELMEAKKPEAAPESKKNENSQKTSRPAKKPSPSAKKKNSSNTKQ